MDISPDILSSLSLINSDDITVNDLNFILDQCNQCIQNKSSLVKSTNSKVEILVFAIDSLMLEAVKYRIDTATLIRTIENELNCDNNKEKFNLFKDFIEKSMKKLDHNVKNIDISNEIRFKDLLWSQWIDVNDSIEGNERNKNYLINIIGQKQSNNNDGIDSNSISIKLSEQQLQDFYFTIRDCVKMIENYI